MIKVVILGAGGFAREVADIFDAFNNQNPTYDILGYIVDAEYGQPGVLINNKPILGGFDWFTDERKGEVSAICGVGAPEIRFKLVKRAKIQGIRFCSVIHPNAVMSRWISIGEGSVVAAGCVFTNQISVGNHVHVNLDCTIGHDAILEDYVTLAPGVHVSGNVHLSEGAYVGTGANIIEKKIISDWSVVGAGSAIISNVPPNTTVVGVPGKVIKTRPEGWHLI